MTQAGLSADIARARAQILYLGVPRLCAFGPAAAENAAGGVLDELLRIAVAR